MFLKEVKQYLKGVGNQPHFGTFWFYIGDKEYSLCFCHTLSTVYSVLSQVLWKQIHWQITRMGFKSLRWDSNLSDGIWFSEIMFSSVLKRFCKVECDDHHVLNQLYILIIVCVVSL